MPKTWYELRARRRLDVDPHDPRDNTLAGTAYLRELRNRFGFFGFLAAYNAGPERYADHLVTGASLSPETQNCVAPVAQTIDGSQPKGLIGEQIWRSRGRLHRCSLHPVGRKPRTLRPDPCCRLPHSVT